MTAGVGEEERKVVLHLVPLAEGNGPGDTEAIPGNYCLSWQTNDRRRTFSDSKKFFFLNCCSRRELISLEREEPLHVSQLAKPVMKVLN